MEDSRSKPPGVDLITTSEMWFLDDIRDNLSDSNMCLLRSSCFGHLFEICELKFQGELLNLLCRRLHSSSLDQMTLLFNFGDHMVKFGAADFCVMTGLKFSGSATLPKQSKFHGLVFASQANMKLCDVQKEFRKECGMSGGNSVRSLKLAYIFIVYGLLITNNLNNGKLDLGYLHLFDDLNCVNDFPWGRVAFEYLVTSTHRVKKDLSSLRSENTKITLEANGFVYALQCWAFEVIPALGTFCASMNPNHLKSFPRILKWSVSRNLGSADEALWKFFLPDHGCDPVRIALSSREIEKLVDLGITSTMHVASPAPIYDITKHVGRKLDFDGVERQKSVRKNKLGKRKGSPLGSSPLRSSSSKGSDRNDCVKIADNKKKKSAGSNLKCSPLGSSPLRSTSSKGNSNMHVVTPECMNVVASTEYNDVMTLWKSLSSQLNALEKLIHSRFSHFEALFEKYSSRMGCSCGVGISTEKVTNIDSVMDSDCDAEMFRQLSELETEYLSLEKKDSLSLLSNVDVGKEELGVVGGDVNLKTKNSVLVDTEDSRLRRPQNSHYDHMFGLLVYDPNEGDLAYSELKPYILWTEGRSDVCRDNYLMLPSEILKYADSSWFNILWRRDGWLENTQALTEANIRDFAPIVMPYVCGKRPIRGGLNWLAATHVFGVANINKCHWVFFEISLHEQVITVYNSLAQPWECILRHFVNVRKNLPIICKMGGLWERSITPSPCLLDIWQIVEFKSPPRQVNNFDCGIMVMKYMECRAFNFPISEIKPERCGISRQRYCAKLFKLAGDLKREPKE